jgi:hypothetical protein
VVQRDSCALCLGGDERAVAVTFGV